MKLKENHQVFINREKTCVTPELVAVFPRSLESDGRAGRAKVTGSQVGEVALGVDRGGGHVGELAMAVVCECGAVGGMDGERYTSLGCQGEGAMSMP